MQNSVKALVDEVNAILAQIDTLTAYNAGHQDLGSPGRRRLAPLAAQLPAEHGLPGLTTPRWPIVGLQTDRYGKLVFDADQVRHGVRRRPGARSPRSSPRRTVDGLRRPGRDHRRQGERQVHRHHHRRHHRPHLGDHASSRTTSTTGTPPRAASYDAPAPVHRPRDGDEPDDQPVQLARRTDQVPIRIIVTAKEGKTMMMTDARAAYMDASVATADPSTAAGDALRPTRRSTYSAPSTRRSPATTRRRTASWSTPRRS